MPTELTFSVTYRVRGSVEEVWRVLGDFGSEHRWTTTLVSCEHDTEIVRVGTVRRCRLPRPVMGRRQVDERLTEFEPGRSLAYVLDGGAGPFATVSSRWSTAPTSAEGTAVTVQGIFTPRSRCSSPARTARGSAGRARTPTGCCGSTSPRGTDLSRSTTRARGGRRDVNGRPRKRTPSWITPTEALTRHLLLIQQGGVATTG